VTDSRQKKGEREKNENRKKEHAAEKDSGVATSGHSTKACCEGLSGKNRGEKREKEISTGYSWNA